jgi:hypothetical protein
MEIKVPLITELLYLQHVNRQYTYHQEDAVSQH